jgi:hypothetical protein
MAGRISAHAYDGEMRVDAASRERLAAGDVLGPDLLRERPPVEQPGH